MIEANLLTPKQVAEILNVSRSWVYDNSWNKRIPSVKIGSHLRFRKEDIVALIGKKGGNDGREAIHGRLTDVTNNLIRSIGKANEALHELSECLVLFLENLEEVSK